MRKIFNGIVAGLILTFAFIVPLAFVGPQMVAFADDAPIYMTVANVTLTSANTEYSYSITNGTGSITIKSRTAADFKMASGSGLSGSTYFTVPSGSAYYETYISSYKNTFYFQSANAGQIVEIVYWNH